MIKRTNESGRTMLEMLGVLAIMGVIMYGAISGISFGVEMYQINAAYHQIEELSEGIVDLYSWSRGYPDFGSGFIETICSNDLTDCRGRTGSREIKSPIGGAKVTIGCFGKIDDNKCTGFSVSYSGLSYLACSRLKNQTFRHVECFPNTPKTALNLDEGGVGSCNEGGANSNTLYCYSR